VCFQKKNYSKDAGPRVQNRLKKKGLLLLLLGS